MSERELRMVMVPGFGTEDVLVGSDGAVWTGTADGVVHRIDPSSGQSHRVADTGGRPLGLEWLPDGRLLVCDTHRGLLAVSTDDGSVEVLADSVDGHKMLCCNNAAVARDGTIWFTDSSTHYSV